MAIGGVVRADRTGLEPFNSPSTCRVTKTPASEIRDLGCLDVESQFTRA